MHDSRAREMKWNPNKIVIFSIMHRKVILILFLCRRSQIKWVRFFCRENESISIWFCFETDYDYAKRLITHIFFVVWMVMYLISNFSSLPSECARLKLQLNQPSAGYSICVKCESTFLEIQWSENYMVFLHAMPGRPAIAPNEQMNDW